MPPPQSNGGNNNHEEHHGHHRKGLFGFGHKKHHGNCNHEEGEKEGECHEELVD